MLATYTEFPDRSTSGPSSRYIPTLDGWRAIAMSWVVLSHSQVWTFGRFSTRIVTSSGSRGVQLFFALSGFLICTRLLHEEAESGSISLKGFYLRRLFRIQPAALFYLFVLALFTVLHIIHTDGAGIVGAALMVRNIWPAFSEDRSLWLTGHFWSLAVEEHFYLLFPAFLLLFRRRRLLILCAAILLFEVWIHLVYHHAFLQKGEYLSRTDLQLNFILIGCVFAVALRDENTRRIAQRWITPWTALAYAALIFSISTTNLPPAYHLLLILVYPLLIASTVLNPQSPISLFLELRPIRFLGKVSFSLYLWQQLFLYPFAPAAPGSLRSHNLLCWAASLGCAVLSFYFIETPMIRMGHRIAHRFDHTEPKQDVLIETYANP